MHQCRGCLKYMGGSGGSGWGHYEHESRELMAVCLKKVNGLNRLRLIDAQWIWTEPHSKRCVGWGVCRESIGSIHVHAYTPRCLTQFM